MKHILFSAAVIIMISITPIIALAQKDTTGAKQVVANSNIDSTGSKTGVAIVKNDTTGAINTPADTVAIKKIDTASVVATPMNCYKQWLDAFAEHSMKPLSDGVQEVVIAFKSKESCHCYMGKVEVVGGKIKAPLYVQTEGGDYKTFVAMGKKLDPEFITVEGDGLWNITNGMSVLFQTVDQEYGRIFFYKALNKNKQANKEAPSPSELLNN